MTVWALFTVFVQVAPTVPQPALPPASPFVFNCECGVEGGGSRHLGCYPGLLGLSHVSGGVCVLLNFILCFSPTNLSVLIWLFVQPEELRRGLEVIGIKMTVIYSKSSRSTLLTYIILYANYISIKLEWGRWWITLRYDKLIYPGKRLIGR